MRCSNCGTENEERFAYCTKCGDPLADERRQRKRYGPREPMYPAPDPDEAVQGRPYAKYYSPFGRPILVTKRRFWAIWAVPLSLGLIWALLDPLRGGISLAGVSFAIA